MADTFERAFAHAQRDAIESAAKVVMDAETVTYSWAGTSYDDGRATLNAAANAIRALATKDGGNG